jgi:hypothetical protein
VIIGEQRLDKRVPPEEIPNVLVKTSMIGGQGKTEKTDDASASVTDAQTVLTGAPTGLTDASRKFRDVPSPRKS